VSPTLAEPAEPPGLAVVFSALAEPHRRRVLRLVAAREHTVGELAAALDARQSAVSQHLKVLRDAGLVEVRPVGNRRLYRGRPEGVAPLYDYVRSLWPARLEALRDVIESDLDRDRREDQR
jgi:DNA-binding transcriptional ArsR family regulator